MPRTLAAAVGRFLTPASRSRGTAYFQNGRVAILHSDETMFSARVRGTQPYDVSLRLDGSHLHVACTCPYFEGTLAPCKHIWAAILQGDETRAFEVPAELWLEVDDDPLELSEFSVDHEGGGAVRGVGRAAPTRARTVAPPAWQTFLSRVMSSEAATAPPTLNTGEVVYVLDLAASSASAGALVIQLMSRDRKRSGDWGKPKALSIARSNIAKFPDEHDRRIVEMLGGAAQPYAAQAWSGYSLEPPLPSMFALNSTLQRELTTSLCQTGRFFLRRDEGIGTRRERPLVAIDWDPRPARFHVRVVAEAPDGYTVTGHITRGVEAASFASVLLATGTVVLWRPESPDDGALLTAFETGGAGRWLAQLSTLGPVTVPAKEALALVEALATSDLDLVDCPDELRVDVRVEPLRGALRIRRPDGRYAARNRLEATLSFIYGETEVSPWDEHPVVFDRQRRVAWRRDRAAERLAIARAHGLGLQRLPDWERGGTRLEIPEAVLPAIVRTLTAEGWRVEADGRLYRQAGAVSLDVRSGIDWFELHGSVEFDGGRADLPTLLAAAQRGERFVTLGDGTFGVLPEEWLARAGRIAVLGTQEADHLRFALSQAALLDAWLATQPAVSCDATFARARAALATFDGVAPAEPPATFNGALRGYQRDALGWFEFLRRFGFGGCLADEMGLGKTIMVLAAMDARRLEGERSGGASRPSLIVVPRSLVFNWRQEAARFTPGLRVLDLTSGGRHDAFDRIGDCDIVLSTYGTLRRDIGRLKEIAFDYAVLDEAQAIKNARTSAAKAARLLQADHRLALSGTPVENHLGELWSLFDFLNPGMLGRASIFTAAGAPGRPVDPETLTLLARGLRPFILRRTKEQVASELPARTEQTLYCDLEPPQRALYDELRAHYRASLLGAVDRGGLGRAKLQILEALLRLRQAACHPGLVDRARASDASAKLDVLVPRLQELVEDGRKMIVFSQFTTLLALLRTRLDEADLAYEYLDGRTRDRQARVERFMSNGAPLFLISLKAGGLGLNLTAAEYVFLLDPWWNPAVEAQAIDRAHRIGQTKPVFAFRLIARDTVEEKVLELQGTKRQLADAIIRADESLIRDLKREDLELLLS